MKCAIYGRVSTDREEQKHSLKNQLVLAEKIAMDLGFIVVARYIDEGISGAGVRNRDGIQSLLEDAKGSKFDTVIAKSVSRLGRNTLQSLQTAQQLEKHNIRLILPEDNYDTEKSQSRFMFNLKAILAEEESAKLSERIKLGLQSRARQGKVKASLPPFGYKFNPLSRKLETDETYAPIVKDIFKYYLKEDWGMSKIGNHLMRKQIPTPRTVSGASNAGIRWHQQTIKHILTNPVYIGCLVQHRSETTGRLSDSESYKIRKLIDREHHIIVENTHDAIISREEFDGVQALMKTKGTNKSNGKESLFAHLAKCGDCGCGMHYKPDRRNGAYVCGGYVKHTTSYCTSHIIEEKILLEAIRKVVKAVNLEMVYGVVEGQASVKHVAINKEIKSIERREQKLKQHFDSLLSLHGDGAITTHQFKEKNNTITEQQLEIANQKFKLHSQLDKKKDSDKNIQALKKVVESFLNLDKEDRQEMKSLLQSLIKNIEVYENGKIKIHYNLAPKIK